MAFVGIQLKRLYRLALLPFILTAGILLAGFVLEGIWSLSRIRLVMMVLTQVPVFAAGLSTAFVLNGDPIVELAESTPTGWRKVQVTRLLIITGAFLAAEGLLFIGLHVMRLWPRDMGWVSIITPVGSIFIVNCLVFLIAVLTTSMPTSSLASIAIWLFLCFIWDPYITDPVRQRLIPLFIAAAGAIFGWKICNYAERNVIKMATL
ncbi:hypothetical protein H3S93_06510 [Bifidobacterium sp. W8109]|uniref:hypothetical protein n=1 Tax=Bifidobacterium TaxID=1678 RepID=UPI0018DD43A1|nr:MULTISPECIES: hypothetical protein [Bifidobacterium]MBH9971957.1 hypothetical protein [Bifidobacterium asteroides]MBI0073603.1 hypothetical protein [Bifidobacterium sp. W8110]